MSSSVPTGDIAAGDLTDDDKSDVASVWSDGLWYQDGATLAWTKIDNSPPFSVTAGDVNGDGWSEIIGTWDSGIWYWDVAAAEWINMASSTPTGELAAGDFTGDGRADVASIWGNGIWYQDGTTLAWTKISGAGAVYLTAGDVTGSGIFRGVVEGTIILAVVNDEIVASEDTSGRTPDVDTDGDDINESFSFTLTGIPLDSDVRIFIVEKGEIFPLYFDSNGDGATDTNALSLSCLTSVNLGIVDTDVKEEDGRGIPENNPIDNLCVEAEVENTDIPTSLFEPDTSGLSLSQLISRGLDALKEAWVLRADTYFKAAEALAGSSTSNDADTARFFYALTRVAALGFDTYSDGIPNNGFNALGDILDGFDSPSDDTKRSNLAAISFPDPLPDDSPTGSDLQGFLINVLPEFQGAITNLDAVSESFNKDWMEPFDGEFVESDYGDVLFFKAMFKSALASVFAQSAYNLDADIDNTVNNDKTIEQFLNDETDFLTLSAAPGNDLNSAKNTIEDGLDDFDAAIVWMDAETDFQDDDFINLGDATAEEINQARADIVDAKNSLNEPTVVNDNKNPDDGFELDMRVFFAGLDFRNPNLLPTFSENDPVGLFPDATFGETFGAGIDLNEDTDPADGNADIFKHWPF